MKNKNILLVICIVLLVSIAAIGCRPAERPVPQPAPNQQTIDRNRTTTDNNLPDTNNMAPGNNRMTTDTDNRITTDNRTTTDNRMNGTLSDRADEIVNEVTKLKDVRSATVVITDNTALVGINLTSGTKGNLNAQIKKEVEDAVRRADRDIDRVSVTADPDLFTRIENIARDIGQGRPISGFATEVEEIIRRITPGA
ncbi:YhcN/YlaJ family sporulation lipoprotein [Alkaliphilus sp. MSJ-5]|uniref:YhcN/YlaJ family sporulation lipoprotein n=1 Tax=Alkaliphilus flagellatus TaxID=2841507 RepID=A0ABS6G7A5_9FIRM|nr:YhcN/YlaJ family sporulation lipoprotein [Alkaliphilus flagellatus]MBU5677281.1 YhcN/YlaJ family sporulation lipoprotein [Alkaliphilus flagellatus]